MSKNPKCCICDNESTKNILLGDHLYSVCDEHLLIFDIAVYNAYVNFRNDRTNFDVDIVQGKNCEVCGASCEKDDLTIIHIKDLDVMLCENCTRYFNKVVERTLNYLSIFTSMMGDTNELFNN